MGCEKANEKGGDAPEHGEKPCRGKEEGKIKKRMGGDAEKWVQGVK